MKIVNPLEENLKEFKKVVDFFKSLDEEQIDMFIKHGKENVENFGNEENWREVIHKIQSEN